MAYWKVHNHMDDGYGAIATYAECETYWSGHSDKRIRSFKDEPILCMTSTVWTIKINMYTDTRPIDFPQMDWWMDMVLLQQIMEDECVIVAIWMNGYYYSMATSIHVVLILWWFNQGYIHHTLGLMVHQKLATIKLDIDLAIQMSVMVTKYRYILIRLRLNYMLFEPYLTSICMMDKLR